MDQQEPSTASASGRKSSRIRTPSAKLREVQEPNDPPKKRARKKTINQNNIATPSPNPLRDENNGLSSRQRKSNLTQTPDQLGGEGQALLALHELDEESRTLKYLRDKVAKQILELEKEEHAILLQMHTLESQMSQRQQIQEQLTVPDLSLGPTPSSVPILTSDKNREKQDQKHFSLRALIMGNSSSKFDMYNHNNEQVLDNDTGTNGSEFGAPAENITVNQELDFLDDFEDEETEKELRKRLKQSEEYSEDEEDEDDNEYLDEDDEDYEDD